MNTRSDEARTEKTRTDNARTDNATADPARTKRLMRALVSFTAERWPSADRFFDLCDAEGGTDPHTRIMFLTGVRRIISEMPVKVFVDLAQRDQVLNAAQDALDELIDELETADVEPEEAEPEPRETEERDTQALEAGERATRDLACSDVAPAERALVERGSGDRK